MEASQRKRQNNLSFGKTPLDSFQLKLIAAFAMLCSHIYKCLLVGNKEFLFLDLIGRIAFPIFCFVLVEGFCHTGNRKKYLMRLWIGAVASEIPFDMAFFGQFYSFEGQNVLFTMLIGMLALIGMEKCSNRMKVLPVAAAMITAWLLKVDYGFYGIWLIVMFYLLRGMKRELVTVQVGSYIASMALYGWIQVFSVLALPFVACYNGEKGKGLKYFFYVFYPMHLIVLTVIRFIMGQ